MQSKQQETRYRIIHKYQRYLINENTNRKPGSGFTRRPLNKDWAGKEAFAFKNNPELSIRDVAKRYDMSNLLFNV